MTQSGRITSLRKTFLRMVMSTMCRWESIWLWQVEFRLLFFVAVISNNDLVRPAGRET